MALSLSAEIKEELRRSLRTVEETKGARLTIDGKSLINFSSNNYLGMARHPQVLEAVKQVIEHWGAGATSSRLISGTSIIHQDLEAALAAFVGKEAALLFPTGYMANLGVITSLVGSGDAILMDRLCHASLVDAAHLSGARLFVFSHADPDAAEDALKRAASYRRRLLVTESLFSMDGDFAPLKDLADLARRYGAMSLVDDAHALGVWKTETSDWDIAVGTLSKALGTQGGFVAGSQDLMETLLNKARSFIFTTGLSPLCVAAAQAALSLIQENAPHPAFGHLLPQGEKEVPSPLSGRGPSEARGEGSLWRLHALSSRLRKGVQAIGFDILGSQSQIVPIQLGEPKRTLAYAEYLFKEGFFAPAIRPPTVHAGQCRIRFSVTAEHTEENIDSLLKVLGTWRG